jgi:uncharacterized membrane-anchored protein YitT (DUF2179 family)
MAFSLDYSEQSLKKLGMVIADDIDEPVGRVYYLDLGKVSPETVEDQHMQQMKESMVIVNNFMKTFRFIRDIADADMDKFLATMKVIEEFDEFFEGLGH